MERRLAAVLIADVVGYGRLSQVDEEGTRARFQADQNGIFEPLLLKHHGRLVKTMGDGLLMEFSSVVDALRFAVELQRSKAIAKPTSASEGHLVYRIGVNLGDVIVEGNDIHGDGVNIAERLQNLAEPGGVTVSAPVYDQVKAKPEFELQFLGERRLKNISDALRVYRVESGSNSRAARIGGRWLRTRLRRWPLATAAILLAAAGAIAVALYIKLPSQNAPADGHSLIVLPFVNMSGDPEQEYFADGITEDLTTDLAQIAGLSVIARNTAFSYKGRTVKPSQIAEDIGVTYVLEGSIRHAGDVVRINAQLIDAANESHLWADRFDGTPSDIFSLQDKVTRSIVQALKIRLTAEEQLAIGRQETQSFAAYDAFLRGWELIQRGTAADLSQAVPHLTEATELDPNYGRAYAALALVYTKGYNTEWAKTLGSSVSEARTIAERYLTEARRHPTALSHQVAALALWIDNRTDEALTELQDAILLNPGDALTYAYMAGVLTTAGRPADAMPHIERAMRLDPKYPSEFAHILAMAQFAQEQYELAAGSLETATKLNSGDESHFLALAATYGHLGRRREAMSAIARYNAIRATFKASPTSVSESPRMRFRRDEDVERFRMGLRLAGMPEASGAWLWQDEISKLLFGHRVQGFNPQTREEYVAEFSSDGKVAKSGDWGTGSGGTVRLDQYQLCIVWPDSRSECVNMFRNDGGTKAERNEYVWLSSNGPYPFSVVE